MKIPKIELENFSNLVTGLIEQSDNIEALCYALNRLTLEELERVKTYFSGSATRVIAIRQREIVMGTFLSGMLIFLFNMYQSNLIVFFFWVLFSVTCVLEFLRLLIAKKPIHKHISLAFDRTKYDRIVSITDIILNKRYENELQKTIEKFSPSEDVESLKDTL
ncbi:hypothetical protein HB847_01310 [Listeria booriae]|uniref:Uncharacterized protein n=1 Tax=Listeria booriae TaxID=1552123 RepID=A0A841X989_9LIST|nr:hypothetical protein [Listeria booriae]MBC1284917.1 hypothetical protein [Listeria booriae]MBC1370987.1 hypothetical protein [Listeria booriae]MBC1892479.1 hypothetical protein [Listeria booriae]MBC2067304.1 hypothetical protein [Listeria booriae]